jgi:hypothetical protein
MIQTAASPRIAIDQKMRQRPDFYGNQHRMAQPVILPGAGFMEASATKANHMRLIARCRVQVGGVHTMISPSAR